MARIWAAATSAALLASAGCASRVEPHAVIPASMHVEAACEVLQGDEPSIIPTDDETTGIAGSLEYLAVRAGVAPASGTDAIVYVEPTEADQLDEVASLVADIPGVDVVTTVDQDASYGEFVEIFEGTSVSVETITPGILPPRVEVELGDGTEMYDLERALDDDDRIYTTIDAAGRGDLLVDQVRLIQVQFGDELVALRDSGPMPFREPIARLLEAADGPPDEARVAVREMARLIVDRCR